MNYSRSTHALINTRNLSNNYKIIKEQVRDSEVICVVKADAYGHGVKHCAETLYGAGAKYFAVSSLSEAVELREILPEAEILILGYTPWEEAETLVKHNIIQTVYSGEYAKLLSDNASHVIRAHVKVNTGMNRLGFDSAEELLSVYGLKNIKYEGIYTHFSSADEGFVRLYNAKKHFDKDDDDDFTLKQLSGYNRFLDELKAHDIVFEFRHTANSAAVLNYPETHFDAVRAGIIMYGLQVGSDVNIIDLGIKPVMTLNTVISHVHDIKKGDVVGYGSTFTAENDMKIATLPIGYADGFIRAYNTKGTVTVNGRSAHIVGRICMDQCMIDVTDIDVKIGDEVMIFGDGAFKKAEDYAEYASTINYETVCLVGKRVSRVVCET